jgi:hypothetical protein
MLTMYDIPREKRILRVGEKVRHLHNNMLGTFTSASKEKFTINWDDGSYWCHYWAPDGTNCAVAFENDCAQENWKFNPIEDVSMWIDSTFYTDRLVLLEAELIKNPEAILDQVRYILNSRRESKERERLNRKVMKGGW